MSNHQNVNDVDMYSDVELVQCFINFIATIWALLCDIPISVLFCLMSASRWTVSNALNCYCLWIRYESHTFQLWCSDRDYFLTCWCVKKLRSDHKVIKMDNHIFCLMDDSSQLAYDRQFCSLRRSFCGSQCPKIWLSILITLWSDLSFFTHQQVRK